MTDEYETKLLAEDSAMAEHVKKLSWFDTEIALCLLARADASSKLAQDTYDDMVNMLTDCRTALAHLVKETREAAHMNPMSAERGKVCSKKKMGAVG